MTYVNTIIIGGGVSGMACGKTLYEKDKDFLLLTKDIGGRMLVSKSRTVNYGASYITSDYKNIMPYMGGGERLKISDSYFFNKNRLTTLYCWENIFELPKLIKLYGILRDFRKRINNLRKAALYESQKKLLESDPVLKSYTKKSAKDFVKENKLERLNEVFFNPVFNSTAFMGYNKANTLAYLDTLVVILSKTYMANHERCCRTLMEGWKDKVVEAEVYALSKNKKGEYIIKSSHGTFRAKNVVLALPYKDAKKFWDVPKPKYNLPIYVIHVAGERQEIYKNKKIVFLNPKQHDITIIWKQLPGGEGEDIIFSKIANPELKEYYSNYRLIQTTYWETATVLSGENWVEQKLDNGLYLASDYNICGLEDAFITGVYAANQIINSK